MKKLKSALTLLLLILIGGGGVYVFYEHGDSLFRRKIQEAGPEQSLPKVTPPTFDVVRVERTGEMVIAGMAPPGWKVEVETGEGKIGETTAEFDGAWLIVPDKPLPQGDYSLALKAISPDGKRLAVSPQRVAVSVAGRDKPLVALSTEGEPTRLLESRPEDAAKVPGAGTVDKPEDRGGAPEGRRGGSRPPEPADSRRHADAPAQPAPADEEPEAASSRRSADVSVRQSSPSREAAAAQEQGRKDSQMASLSEPRAELEPAPLVAFSAVDYEDQGGTARLFMSGKAAAGRRVALYIDNRFVGTAMADAAGVWEFTLSDVFGPGKHTLRADQVDLDSGKVLARAEVMFEAPVLQSGQASLLPELSATAEPATPDAPRAEKLVATGKTAGAGELAAREPAVPSAGEVQKKESVAGTHASDESLAEEKLTAAEENADEPNRRVVIVRRGDTLWHIAKRHYGQGYRYTKIYRSNRDQIRNPHWIYPQQQFVIPR